MVGSTVVALDCTATMAISVVLELLGLGTVVSVVVELVVCLVVVSLVMKLFGCLAVHMVALLVVDQVECMAPEWVDPLESLVEDLAVFLALEMAGSLAPYSTLHEMQNEPP